MDLIEKAAMAVWDSEWGEGDFDSLHQNSIQRGMALQMARAVIEAIRVPSEAMLNAPDKIMDGPAGSKFIVRADREVWETMIDALLADPNIDQST